MVEVPYYINRLIMIRQIPLNNPPWPSASSGRDAYRQAPPPFPIVEAVLVDHFLTFPLSSCHPLFEHTYLNSALTTGSVAQSNKLGQCLTPLVTPWHRKAASSSTPTQYALFPFFTLLSLLIRHGHREEY